MATFEACQSLGETFGMHEDFLLVAHAGLSVRRGEEVREPVYCYRGVRLDSAKVRE